MIGTGLQRQLPPTPSAPGLAREAVHSFLGDAPQRAVEVADLLVSEVVANAVLHARSAAVLSLHAQGPMLRVEVADAVRGGLCRRDVADENGGFGLRIVDALAERWGVDECDGGKVVWFELCVDAPPA